MLSSLSRARIRPGWIILFLLAGGGAVFAGEPRLRIAVRSDVDQPFEGWGKAPLKEHGRTYTLVYMQERKSALPLLKPVAPESVAKVLVAEMKKQGFEALPMEEKPELLLGATYGRAYVKNPYYKDNIAFGKTLSLVGVSGLEYFARMKAETGFREKVQDADNEKLFIRIIAWENPRARSDYKPGDEGKKLHEVWRTTVLINDPDNRDLNEFLEKMLAAAAPLFDHKVKDEEEIVNTSLPEGYVRLGEAKEVPDKPGDNETTK